MATPVTVNYTTVGEDWQVSVVRGDDQRSGRAPGLIAARDTADQLVEQLTNGENAAVVHLLNGDAVAFSTAYLHARHGGPAGAPTERAAAPAEPAESAWPTEPPEAAEVPETADVPDTAGATERAEPADGADTGHGTGTAETDEAGEPGDAAPGAPAAGATGTSPAHSAPSEAVS